MCFVSAAQGMVLLAALSSIELYETPAPPEKRVPSPCIIFATQPNGRCFWSCLFLALAASLEQKSLWRLTPRNTNGYPIHQGRLKSEDEMVKSWALSLNKGDIPETIKERIEQSHTAEADDMDPRQLSLYHFG